MGNLTKSFILFAMCLLSCATNAQELFEGELLYRSFENHSKLARKLSKDMNYNGAREQRVLIKGNKIMTCDQSVHLNILLDGDKGKVVIYSNLLKRGICYKLDEFIRDYLSTFSQKATQEGEKKEYNINVTNETTTLKGMDCKKIKGEMKKSVTTDLFGQKITQNSTGKVDLWYTTKYKVSPVYSAFANGLAVDGIVVKGTIEILSKIPLFGRCDSFSAMELKEITQRKVADSEFEIPADVNVTETDSAFKMLGIYGDQKKYLKEHNMYPTDADKNTDVKYQIDQEWDY